MKKLLLAVSALALSAATASAADLAAKPYVKAPVAPLMYDWSGWYVGVNGGGGWDAEGWNLPVGGPSLASFTGSGGTAGGQFGWRTQTGWLVWGFDIQGNWADIKGSGSSGYYSPTAYKFQSTVTTYETVAATAGYAINNVLLYAKGGAAAVQSKNEAIYLPNPATGYSITESRWGGLLGAGLEYGLTPNWTIGVEYNHIFGGGNRVEVLNYNPGGGTWPIAISQSIDLVTARLNYKFGGPVVARY